MSASAGEEPACPIDAILWEIGRGARGMWYGLDLEPWRAHLECCSACRERLDQLLELDRLHDPYGFAPPRRPRRAPVRFALWGVLLLTASGLLVWTLS